MMIQKNMLKMGHKRIHIFIAVLLAVCVGATMIPTAGYADSTGDKKLPTIKYKVVKGASKEKTRLGKRSDAAEYDEELDYYKEVLLEVLDEAMLELYDRETYCDDIWQEIEDAHSYVYTTIQSANKESDLLVWDPYWIIIRPDIVEKIEIIAALGEYTTNTVRSRAADLPRLKKSGLEDINDLAATYRAGNYNSFYRARINGTIREARQRLNDVKSFAEYISASTYVAEYLWEYAENDEEDDDLIEIVFSDDEEDEEEFSYIYTNREVALERAGVMNRVNLYVNKQLKRAEYKGDMQSIKKAAEALKKQLEGVLCVEEIVDVGDKWLNKWIKTTGVDYTDVTLAQLIRMVKSMNKIIVSYYGPDYSFKSMISMALIIMKYTDRLSSAEKAIEVEGLDKDMKKELDKVIKITPEFKQEQIKAVNTLKSYTKGKNKKKYNQKKVKKLIKKGTSELNNVGKSRAKKTQEDLDKLESINIQYVAMLKKAINQYKITIKKQGKGKVTKSAKVKYGKKFVVEITPAPGYKIKSVKIDGKRKKLKNKYVFKSVKKKHSVKIVFGK